nr:MAG TPA: hypothetical protein [Bacteriophage sp.]
MYDGLKTYGLERWQRSTLTYPEDHSVLESRVNVRRSSPCRDSEISILIIK